jgi:hypothetical protein
MIVEGEREQGTPILSQSEQLTERLASAHSYLLTEIRNFAAHVGVYHPSGVPATTCHGCNTPLQHIVSTEISIKRIERDLASVNNALNSQV